MKRRILIAYQTICGLSDTGTGLLLIFSPALTLHLMKLQAVPDTLPFLSYIGVFVLSVGITCLYGAFLALRPAAVEKLETVWLLTAMTRGLVALFVVVKVVSGDLESGWITVAITDALFATIQAAGLAKGWLRHVED